MKRRDWFRCICGIASLALLPQASADVIVVGQNGGPGVAFKDIPPAVAAAQAGDTILVLDGNYSSFEIDGKALTVRADAHDAVVHGEVRLRNGSPATTMRLIGMTVQSQQRALLVEQNQGRTSISDCSFRGGHGTNAYPPGITQDGFPAVVILSSAAVVMLGCTAQGGFGANIYDPPNQTQATSGGHGLVMEGSNVYVYECDLIGGLGGDIQESYPGDGGNAGTGARLTDGYLFAGDTLFEGKRGGRADCSCSGFCCGDGGAGGHGLALHGVPPLAHHMRCIFIAGAGGTSMGGSPGTPGQPILVHTGHAEQVPAMAPPLCFGDGSDIPCPCGNDGAPEEGCANSSGAGARLFATGTSSIVFDDFALHAAQATPAQTCIFLQGAILSPFPFRDGIRCAGSPIVRLETSALDAAGAASTTVSIPIRGGVAPGDTRYYQLWYRDPFGPCGSGSNLSHALRLLWQ